MTKKNIEKEVIQVLRSVLQEDEEKEITIDTNLTKDLAMDSLDSVELLLGLENWFGISFVDDTFLFEENETTVKEVVESVRLHLDKEKDKE